MSFDVRHASYRDQARRLRSDPRSPPGMRGACFFDAAALVNGPAALGLLQRRRGLLRWLARLGGVDAASYRLLDGLGAWLLQRNLDRLARLRAEADGPDVPLGIAPPAFDDDLVVFEQRAVDDYLRLHPVPSAARRDVDRLLAAAGSRVLHRVLGVDRCLHSAIRRERCRVQRPLSFFDLETRIAIGRQLVRCLGASRRPVSAAREARNGYCVALESGGLIPPIETIWKYVEPPTSSRRSSTSTLAPP